MSWNVAILGATGLVGERLRSILVEREFPIASLRLLASARSAGRRLSFRGEEIEVEEARPESFDGVDLVLSSAGGSVSEALLPSAAERGALSIDNTSAFRMDEDVPLVVPEVNPHRLEVDPPKGIIANPNCSTIQLVVVLKPLLDAFGLSRVIVSSYQSVSGAGQAALDEMFAGSRAILDGRAPPREKFPTPIAFDALPHIDVFRGDGDTKEEWKIRVETRKILEAAVGIHATCVRVPIAVGHGEAVWIETHRSVRPEEVREVLAGAPGVEVVDDPANLRYPTPRGCEGEDVVRVGRIRRDPSTDRGIALWIVADNLRKGAALNAVQIAEVVSERWARDGR